MPFAQPPRSLASITARASLDLATWLKSTPRPLAGATVRPSTDRSARTELGRLWPLHAALARRGLIAALDLENAHAHVLARDWHRTSGHYLHRRERNRRPCSLPGALLAEVIRDLRAWLVVRGWRWAPVPRWFRITEARTSELERAVRHELAILDAPARAAA